MLQGCMTALVTPFANGRVDYATLKKLVERQIRAGIDGLVPCGTTGESPCLSHEEHQKVITETIRYAQGRVPVIAGAGSNNTVEAVALTKHAAKAGADAVLSVCPYYNKPTQEGLFEHYSLIAASVKIPIVVYNIPGRSGRNIEPETLIRLARARKNIKYVKEASGSFDAVSKIVNHSKVTVFSGDDGIVVPMMSLGAKGVISVFSNLEPREFTKMTHFALKGDFRSAARLQLKYHDLLCGLMNLENNPIGIKTAMRLKKLINGELRLPQTPMSPAKTVVLQKLLKGAGL